MADTAAQVRDVARLLREWGHDVREVDGWEHRGREPMTTDGRCEHHTAGGDGNAPSLRVVVHGRKGLRNSLSRWFVARDGTIYLVALRTSWHAGRGDKGSNSTLSGTEAEHSGSPDERWGEASLKAQADISAAELAVFGVDPSVVWDHREHATPRGRKSDRVHIDSPRWRDRVRKLLAGRDEPEPNPDDPEDDDMAVTHVWTGTDPQGDKGKWKVDFITTDDGYAGTYRALVGKEATVFQDRADRKVPGFAKSDLEAQADWFVGLKRVERRA